MNGLLVVRLDSLSGTAVNVGVLVDHTLELHTLEPHSRRAARIGSRRSSLMSSAVPFKLQWYANFCTTRSDIHGLCNACARLTRAPLR